MRRGFVFTLDALLALLLVVIFVSGVFSVVNNQRVYSVYAQSQNKEVAETLLNTLRTVSLSELVPPGVLQNWTATGILDTKFVTPDMTPLQIVATYWAINGTYRVSPSYQRRAEIILGYILQSLTKGYKYQLIINNYTSPFLTFDNSYENATNVGAATTFVSGYVSNTTPRGYVAKMYLTKGTFMQEKVIGIQRVLVAGNGGLNKNYVSLTYYGSKPLTVNDFGFSYIAAYYGGDDIYVDGGGIYLNASSGLVSYLVNESLEGDLIKFIYYSGWSSRTYYLGNYTGFRASWIDEIDIGTQMSLYVSYYTRVFDPIYPRDPYVLYIFSLNSMEFGSYDIYFNSGTYVYILTYFGRIVTSGIYNTHNQLTINATLEFPLDSIFYDANWSLVQRAGYESLSVSVNGNLLSNPYNYNISQYLIPGTNMIQMNFTNFGDPEMGSASGSHLYVKYKTSYPVPEFLGTVGLYSIQSYSTGIYYLNALFVPGNITGINITLTFSGVHEVNIYLSNGTDMLPLYRKTGLDGSLTTLIISNATLVGNITKYISLSNLSKRSFELVICLDSYYNSTYTRPVRYWGLDYKWQYSNPRILYGYPNSSITISYAPSIDVQKFFIPMQIYIPSDDISPGVVSTSMAFSYYLPAKAIPWYVDVWVSWRTSQFFIPGNITLYENYKKFSKYPLDYYLLRISYTKLYPFMMLNGTINVFNATASSFGDTYKFNPSNTVALIHYFLNAYAPYGKIFPYFAQNNACGYNLTYYYNFSGTIGSGNILVGSCPPGQLPISLDASQLNPSLYALDDAIVRLFEQLGAKPYNNGENPLPGSLSNPIMVKLEGLSIDTIGIKNIPNTLAGVQITLRIWR